MLARRRNRLVVGGYRWPAQTGSAGIGDPEFTISGKVQFSRSDKPVPLRNAVMVPDLRVHGVIHAARRYSLMMPPSTFQRRTGAASDTMAGSS
jgi:hypothetical protein